MYTRMYRPRWLRLAQIGLARPPRPPGREGARARLSRENQPGRQQNQAEGTGFEPATDFSASDFEFNRHVHLHACVTDGVFRPAAAEAGCDTPPTFLPARPISQANLAALTERVRRRAIRWFRMQRLLDAAAAADMLAWENSGVSVDASVRITLLPPQVRV